MAPRKRTSARGQLAVAEAWRSIAASPEGKAVIADLMMFCGVYSPHAANEAFELARCEGRREVGLHITKMLDLRPSDFPERATVEARQFDGLYGQGELWQ